MFISFQVVFDQNIIRILELVVQQSFIEWKSEIFCEPDSDFVGLDFLDPVGSSCKILTATGLGVPTPNASSWLGPFLEFPALGEACEFSCFKDESKD